MKLRLDDSPAVRLKLTHRGREWWKDTFGLEPFAADKETPLSNFLDAMSYAGSLASSALIEWVEIVPVEPSPITPPTRVELEDELNRQTEIVLAALRAHVLSTHAVQGETISFREGEHSYLRAASAAFDRALADYTQAGWGVKLIEKTETWGRHWKLTPPATPAASSSTTEEKT